MQPRFCTCYTSVPTFIRNLLTPIIEKSCSTGIFCLAVALERDVFHPTLLNLIKTI